MKNTLVYAGLLIFSGLMSGCAIKHPVAKDYPQHLAKSSNAEALPKTSLDAEYFIDDATQNHHYEFRAATVGYAHVWIVEFGKILDETLRAPYVQTSFGRLVKSTGESGPKGNLVSFSLESYEFKNYHAYVALRVQLTDAGSKVLDKVYKAEGISRGGQMWAAGPFGMKDATLDSTKSAVDRILTQFIEDIPKN